MKRAEKIRLYLNGFLIGVVLEYGYRVEFGIIQKALLFSLLVGVAINLILED